MIDKLISNWKKKKSKNSVLRSENGKAQVSLKDGKIEIKANKINLNHP